MKRFKARATLAAATGFVLLTIVLGVVGVSPVLGAMRGIGAGGFAVFCLYWLLVVCTLGLAWFTVAPGLPLAKSGGFIWARLLREAASDVLPFSQVGGLLIGARAAVRSSIPETLVFASTIVDLTTELTAQLLYTLAGVSVLALRLSASPAAAPVLWAALGGLLLMVVVVFAFFIAQRRGSGWVGWLAERWLPGSITRAQAVGATLDNIYRRPRRLVGGVILHLFGWIGSGIGSWIALEFMGAGVPLWAVLTVESLMYTIRSVGFMIPGGIGLQEGAYVLLGPLFGLNAETALALSLLKRGRDLVIGVPTLLIWQVREGHRLLSGPARVNSAVPSPDA